MRLLLRLITLAILRLARGVAQLGRLPIEPPSPLSVALLLLGPQLYAYGIHHLGGYELLAAAQRALTWSGYGLLFLALWYGAASMSRWIGR